MMVLRRCAMVVLEGCAMMVFRGGATHCVYVGSSLQQQPHDVEMSVKSGVAQCRVPRIISPIRLRPVLKQKPVHI